MGDPGFVLSLASIGLAGPIETGRRYVQMRQGAAGDERVKLAATLLIPRWVLIVIAVYGGAMLFRSATPYPLVSCTPPRARGASWIPIGSPGSFPTAAHLAEASADF